MTEIKIYSKRKTVYIVVALSIVSFLGVGYYIFFSGSSQITTNHKYIFFFLTAYLAYSDYVAITRHRKQIPTLVISDFALEVSEYLKTTTYAWKDISDWKIETKDNTEYLTITTIEPRKRMINISFLEKTPLEIEQLIKEIKKL